jgi:hypothetical protein
VCVVVQFSCNFCIECYDGCFVSRLVRGMGDGVGHRRYASLASTSRSVVGVCISDCSQRRAQIQRKNEWMAKRTTSQLTRSKPSSSPT